MGVCGAGACLPGLARLRWNVGERHGLTVGASPNPGLLPAFPLFITWPCDEVQ